MKIRLQAAPPIEKGVNEQAWKIPTWKEAKEQAEAKKAG